MASEGRKRYIDPSHPASGSRPVPDIVGAATNFLIDELDVSTLSNP
jgi:hypothetical protein